MRRDPYRQYGGEQNPLKAVWDFVVIALGAAVAAVAIYAGLVSIKRTFWDWALSLAFIAWGIGIVGVYAYFIARKRAGRRS